MDFSVRDGNLITGQNSQSSRSTAEKVVEALEEKGK
jgi:putative intracellular protease/amidase